MNIYCVDCGRHVGNLAGGSKVLKGLVYLCHNCAVDNSLVPAPDRPPLKTEAAEEGFPYVPDTVEELMDIFGMKV